MLGMLHRTCGRPALVWPDDNRPCVTDRVSRTLIGYALHKDGRPVQWSDLATCDSCGGKVDVDWRQSMLPPAEWPTVTTLPLE